MGFFSWLFGFDNVPEMEGDARWFKEAETQLNREESTPRPPSLVLDAAIKAKIEAEKFRREEERKRLEKKKSDIRYSFAESTSRFSLVLDSDVRLAYDHVQRRVEAARRMSSFAKLLIELVRVKCDGNAATCYKNAGISRQLYSQIISDPHKKISKRTAMQLAIGLGLDVQGAADFVAIAGYAFKEDSFEDVAFLYCIEHKHTIFDVNILLQKAGCPLIDIK